MYIPSVLSRSTLYVLKDFLKCVHVYRLIILDPNADKTATPARRHCGKVTF